MASLETVTVMITDLVGSTGLESRIGPAAADELRGEHFGLIRAALEQSGGREVKSTGDGLMVVFDSAAQAVSCAVAVQQRFERRNRRAPEQLIVKVGLSTGDASVQGGDYFGMPVIEAARLCEQCRGSEILAKELLAHLAAGRGHEFTSRGALELKGLPEPLAAVEVAWQAREESRPLPPRLQEMPPGGFVGRAHEAERLAELLSKSSDGQRRLVLISGEPGIGKTRLATHAALEARSSAGALVLYGRCDEELAIPYGAWVEALQHLVDHAPRSVLSAHAERHGGDLSRLVPQLRERLPDLPAPRETDADTERYLLWGAVVSLLCEASAQEPLVVVLDDLHWADKPTLLLLKHFLKQGQGARVLILGTYRDSDLTRAHPLAEVLADLHRVEGVDRVTLDGLSQEDIVEIMERAGGHELDQASLALSVELHRETDGNPFYAAELLRHLLESGTIYREENGRFTVRGNLSELGMPQSVREVLGRRVDRLGERAREVLSTAAVIGREFDIDLLAAVSERSEDELLQDLEEAVSASVLSESANVPGRFYFAHALVNHTLYEDLGPTRRARTHRRIAEALEAALGEDPGARVGELAHHWAKATKAVDIPKAVTYARMAGARALSELAPDEALRWFSQALELLGRGADEAERCELLIGLGEAQRQSGDAAFRETLLEASSVASELGDAQRAARAALANNRGEPSAYGQVDEERVAAIERALELEGASGDPARRALLLSLQSMELVYELDHEPRRALAEQALALAREAGDPRTLARVLVNHWYAFWAPDTLAQRRELLTEMLQSAASAGDPALDFFGANRELNIRIEGGEMDLAVAAADREVASSEAHGEPTARWIARSNAAVLAILHGELEQAERLSEEAVQIAADAGQPDGYMIHGAQIMEIRFYQGRSEEVIELLEQGVAANPRIAAWRAALARMLCWHGRTEEAAAIVTEAARDSFEDIPLDNVRTAALALYADAAAMAGVTDAAQVLYELIEPWGEQIVWNGAVTYGHASTYMGLLAGTLNWDERADKHLARSCDFHEANRMPLWAARAHLGWAEALSRRGETERARSEAARALELSRRHGYRLFEPRAAAIAEAGSPAQA
ncbi:MAG TPA: AAA family ATPase [Solirubrobacteraceae bacterium]|jgi:class 3 adenylate cyclase/tetratricopeptide (TPR) repeat protein